MFNSIAKEKYIYTIYISWQFRFGLQENYWCSHKVIRRISSSAHCDPNLAMVQILILKYIKTDNTSCMFRYNTCACIFGSKVNVTLLYFFKKIAKIR